MAKRKQNPAPDGDFVTSLYRTRSGEGDEARLRALAQQFRLLTRMDHQVEIPPQYKAITPAVRTPYVRDAWLRITAAMLQRAPVVHVEPTDVTDEAKRAANIVERWDQALLDELAKDLGEDVVLESTRALVRDGESVIKTVHRPDAWANFPRRDRDEDADSYNKRTDRYLKKVVLPFAWRCVDRLQMLFGDGEWGDDWALEYGEYPLAYIGRRYDMDVEDVERAADPSMLGGKPKAEEGTEKASRTVTKLEYFDSDWWTVVVGGIEAPGFPKKNPYSPRLPYHRAKTTDSESLLYALLFLCPFLDRLLTMKSNWAHLGAYPNPTIKPIQTGVAPLGDEGLPTTFQWEPGKALEIPLGYAFDFTSPPPVGQDIDELIRITMGLIDVAGIPSVLRGVVGSDTSGYLANQLMMAASMAFKVGAQSLQRQIGSALEFFHWAVPKCVHNTVYLLSGKREDAHWLGLKAEGSVAANEAPVDAVGPVTVVFRPSPPTDEQSRAMVALQLHGGGLVSRRRAIEKWLQEEDPDTVMDEIAVEQALEQEPIASMIRTEALRQAGLMPAQQPQPMPGAGMGVMGGQEAAVGAMNGVPGQAQFGTPGIPGLTQPIQQPLRRGGRVAGSFPGSPSGPRR